MAIDYTSDLGKIRVLTGDTDESLFFLTDEELTVLMSLSGGGLYETAAEALEVMATKMAIIQQKIKTLDLQTDGPAVAKSLMDRAAQMRERVTAVDDEDFELIDPVVSVMEYWP